MGNFEIILNRNQGFSDRGISQYAPPVLMASIPASHLKFRVLRASRELAYLANAIHHASIIGTAYLPLPPHILCKQSRHQRDRLLLDASGHCKLETSSSLLKHGLPCDNRQLPSGAVCTHTLIPCTR